MKSLSVSTEAQLVQLLDRLKNKITKQNKKQNTDT